jgi:hypothetical protein
MTFVGSLTLEPQTRGSSATLLPGTTVGDYRIDHTIGTGGMGAVYQATQPVIGKRVAIKLLHSSKSQSAVNRFVMEARAVNLIGHPNIVDVFGFGMTDDGRAYLVMELLVGETLAVRAKRSPISIAEICEILVEVTHALEAAHEAGVIHRDLKPENIFLATRKGALNVKLLDFGIAKLIGDGEREPEMRDETRPGVLIGTPRYISPEQVHGKTLDGGADIYALGVVAFELLAGRPPFTASHSYELFEKHAKLKPPKPSAFNAELPEAADTLIGAMLAKEPRERPTLATIRDTLTALRSAPAATVAAVRIPATVTPTALNPVVPAAEATHTTQVARAVTYTRARRIGSFVALGSAAVTGVVLAIVVAHRGSAVAPLPPAALQPEAAAQPPAQPVAVAPVITKPTIEPTIEPTIAPTVGSPAKPPEIELDPVAAGAGARGGAVRHPPVVHGKHDHPPAVKPASEPASERPPEKAADKPTEKPGSASHADDDNGVRSPFERSP